MGRKPIIPPIFVLLTKNLMEQNPVSFKISNVPHVGPYTPYFGLGYGNIGNVPTMWPLVFDP